MTDAILCRDVATVEVLTLSGQHQEMEIPEEAQDKPHQTGGMSSLDPCGPLYACCVVVDTKCVDSLLFYNRHL